MVFYWFSFSWNGQTAAESPVFSSPVWSQSGFFPVLWTELLIPDCYDFSYFVLFTYVFLLFLEVSYGAAALTHFSLTHSTAIVLTPSIAILIALPNWYSIYSGQFCRLFSS